MENFPPTCPDDIPRMLKRFSWRSSCLGFSGPNIFQKAGCSLNVARSSCWTELELISALPLPVAVHDRFLTAVRSHRLVDCPGPSLYSYKRLRGYHCSLHLY